MSLPALLADDLLWPDLEDVERGAAAHVHDEHAWVVRSRVHPEGDLRTEHALVEVGVAVEIGGQRGDVVEPVRDGHGDLHWPRGGRGYLAGGGLPRVMRPRDEIGAWLIA